MTFPALRSARSGILKAGLPPNQEPELHGPKFKRGQKEQYVYWYTWSAVAGHPTAKDPSTLSREGFRSAVCAAREGENITLDEVKVFYEPRGSGKMHHNALVRCGTQFRWRRPVERRSQIWT